MTQPTLLDNEPVFLLADNLAPAMYTPRVLVIGVGDLGCYIGASLVKQHHTGVDGLLVSRKPSLLSTIDYANTLLVNPDGLQNNGEATFDEHGLNDAKELIKESDLVLLVGALGGSSGTPLITLAQCCHTMGVPVIGTVVLPFTFEGKPKKAKADHAMTSLDELCNGLIVLPNDKLKSALSPNTSAFDGLNAGNRFIGELLSELLQVLGQTGLINLDFNDFLTFIHDANMLAPMRTSITGDSVDCLSLFQSSLIAGINTQMVTGVLIHFSVPEDFSLGLMHEFLNALHHAFPKLQQVLSGVTVTKTDAISVLLIASSAQPASY
ncbi:hypothetical protein [Shewanella sp. FJAT-52076]|uniref:hypothetical protein n=1 Tax=Shewanella sp. FJAT-52076 TaxID=2864202 RepID=UPI001C657C54|nr:hypothetical protein [Shewanella sp. FJAT-52076]QYJ73686.1 hypothetical protein K0H79_09720 [Shewanella sp. FJAT-52076]